MTIHRASRRYVPLLQRVVTSLDSRLQGCAPPMAIDASSSPEAFNPLELRYSSTFPRLIELPLDRGIGLDIFPLAGPVHPFVRALRLAASEGYGSNAIREYLHEYYERVADISAHDWLGLGVSSSIFSDQPSWARCLPWSLGTPEGQFRAIEKNALYDSKSAGHALDISHGWKSVGPISPELLEVETQRLTHLTRQIKEKGFILERPGKAVSSVLLYSKDQDWRWLASGGGQHRVAVAYALGLEKIPSYTYNVVRRDEVDIWPQVRSGHISRDDALAFFDRLMAGELPQALEGWSIFTA